MNHLFSAQNNGSSKKTFIWILQSQIQSDQSAVQLIRADNRTDKINRQQSHFEKLSTPPTPKKKFAKVINETLIKGKPTTQ